ncbi:RagB/SusD family nutrient uptake outer membrane protein [Gammaproteobacteria bacterium]|nr:RagB/SusD family nutrient uptake outer membrane protein [Gammaproteobacteria bacterium]
MKKVINYIAVLFAAIIILPACVNDLNVDPIDPQVSQEFNQDAVFNKIYATMALTGQQGPAGNGDVDGIDEGTSAFYRLIWNLNEMPTDEVFCVWGDAGIPELNGASWNASLGMLAGVYGRLNFDITLVNHFLEQTNGKSDAKTMRQRSEARFIRALNYYYMMDLFGNVPFALQVSNKAPNQIKRGDLYAWLETELKDLEGGLYEDGAAPYYRIDKVANWLLLSRMYLNAEVYTGTANWTDAASYAKKVMDSSYGLASKYEYLFMADNDGSAVNDARKEIILPIAQDGIQTQNYGGSTFVIASTRQNGMPAWGSESGWGGNRARKQLVMKFFNSKAEANAVHGVTADFQTAASDDRAMFLSYCTYVDDKGLDKEIECTLESNDAFDFDGGFKITKFTNVRADAGATSHVTFADTDIPFMRKAEAYLIYAEAQLHLGQQGKAKDAIKVIRDRANASELATVSFDDILNERAREFYCEGMRRTDLIRFGRFGGVHSYKWEWKGGLFEGQDFDAHFNLYPIPQSDITANQNLEQNPGY